MSSQPAPHVVDPHILRLIVGIVALALAVVTWVFSAVPLESISASYHAGGWARDALVGSLFAVSAIMLGHNGSTTRERWLSKVAAVAALGVALFPCGCDGRPEIVPYVHYASAGSMFTVLAAFCAGFHARARAKASTQARVRATLYAACGAVIVAVIVVLVGDFIAGGPLRARVPRLVFYGEWAALTAFGASWLIASRTLGWITADTEEDRVRLFAT